MSEDIGARLFVARHGEAVARDIDPAGPLTPQGREDVAAVARLLAPAGFAVARIVHSGKRRAAQTAELLAPALAGSVAPTMVERGDINPNDAVDALISDIAVWHDSTLIVGHLPYLGILVARLVIGRTQPTLVSFAPASLVCLERAGATSWTIAWMLGSTLTRRLSR